MSTLRRVPLYPLAEQFASVAGAYERGRPEALGAILNHEAASFEDQRLDVADLVLVGLITGLWARFEQAVSRGLALEQGGLLAIGADELKASATQFRYARRLLSASEFRAWLNARSLTVADLSGVLGRGLMRERTPDGEVLAEVQTRDLAEVLRAEALCTGIFSDLAELATQRVASAHRLGRLGDEVDDERVEATLAKALGSHAGIAALGEEELRRRLRGLWAYEDALAALREQLSEPAALRRRLADHGLNWLRLEGTRLRFAAEGAAREARALIADDGLGVDEVSVIAGTPASPASLYLDEVPEQTAAALAAVAPGEVAAPWLQDEQWNVFVVRSKAPPSPEDAVLRERATDELLAELLRRQSAGRARLHGAF